ncbi:phage protein [Dickeya chrysanthemi]|uniref:phage protein n=1 Tax=Dickeya chrysanthemi TaxID=556 RepID=UPI000532F3A0|nr:phage protein [Dickeya chrysanthemi]
MQTATPKNTMPYLIQQADFDRKLSIIKNNVEHTHTFLQKGVIDFPLPGFVVPHGYRLVKSRGDEHYRLITDDAESPETVYAVKLRFRNDIVEMKTTCTQIMVWKTVQARHDSAVRGLPQLFFEFFLESHSIVVSDEEQTLDGRRFWEKMISWAMSTNGYRVYVSDGTQEGRPLTFMTSWDDFYSTWAEFCWGGDRECHTHRLLVISKHDLH